MHDLRHRCQQPVILAMNRPSTTKRARILTLLVEDMSMRAISHATGASCINTVTKLRQDPGDACTKHHDETVRDLRAKRVQADEIWSFT